MQGECTSGNGFTLLLESGADRKFNLAISKGAHTAPLSGGEYMILEKNIAGFGMDVVRIAWRNKSAAKIIVNFAKDWLGESDILSGAMSGLQIMPGLSLDLDF